MRYVLLLFITAVTISCSIEEWNSPQSIGDQDLQQIKRDLPSRICAYSPTKFWGENLLHLHIKDGPHYISAKDNSLDPELFIYTKFDDEGNSINHYK